MKSKTYIILGSIISLVSIIILIWLLFAGIVRQIIYSTFQVKGDYWIWGYVLIPLLFILIGLYYLFIGIREKKTNKWISSSAIIQFIALIIGAFGVLYPAIFRIEFGFLITLLLGIPTSILMVFGIILLIVGQINLRK
jgi:hypothetical protein